MPYRLEHSQAIRLFIMNRCHETGRTPSLTEVMQHFGLSREAVIEVYEELEAEHDVVRVPDTQNLLMAFPFSNAPTIHHVTYARGHRAYTVCGLDALGLSYMFPDDEAVIHSSCPHCGEAYEVRCQGRQIVSQSHPDLRIHVGLPFQEWFTNWVLT